MEPGDSEPSVLEANKHAELSRLYIRQADECLARRKKRQASRKGWEAIAQAVKAIAVQRGWNYDSHDLVMDAAVQVLDEQKLPQLTRKFGTAIALWSNIYENWLESDSIEIYLNSVKLLLPELERVRTGPPPATFTPETRDQRNRWRRLTRGQADSLG